MVCGLSSIPFLSLRLSLPVDEAILAADTPPFFSLDYKPRDAVHLHQFLGVNKDPTVAQSGVKIVMLIGIVSKGPPPSSAVNLFYLFAFVRASGPDRNKASPLPTPCCAWNLFFSLLFSLSTQHTFVHTVSPIVRFSVLVSRSSFDTFSNNTCSL